MAVRIIREEIIRIDDCEDFQVETYGELHLMPRTAQTVIAIFGYFERTPNGHLLYSMSADELDINACDSHYLDDLNALRNGNIEIVESRP